MPQMTPMAANSSHPRLLTRPAYVALETDPQRPRFTISPFLLALGVGQARAALTDVARAAAEEEDPAAGAALEGAAEGEDPAAGAALEGAAPGAGVGPALPARTP